MISEEQDIYTYRPWPWISKSAVISDDFCEWLFKLRYIDKIEVPVGLSAHTGTNMHVKVAEFFDKIDIVELSKIPINYEKPITDSRVFQFIMKTIFELIPEDSRDYQPYKIILTNFALMEADHWISLHQEHNGNTNKVLKYFIPNSVEKYIESYDVMLYGTIDRRNMHYTPKKDFIEIYDYKTGHVPKEVRNGMKNVGDEFSWSLPTNKMFELHFYILLDVCRRGYRIHPDLVNYITNPTEFYKENLIPKVDSYFIDKEDKPYDFTKDYHIGIIYLGDKIGPYVPKKKANRRSMAAVFRRIHYLRTKVYINHPWQKQINYWKCKNCSITEQCLTELEKEEMKLESKSDT